MGKPKDQSVERMVISVLVSDRVGILRDITAAVAELGGTVEGISQTVVAGYFTVLLAARFSEARLPEAVRAAVAGPFGEGEADVSVRPLLAVRRAQTAPGSRYVLTIAGPRTRGLLKTVTAFLAERGINVEAWTVYEEGERLTHVGEVTVPALLDTKQLQDEFRGLAERLGLRSCLQHENLFVVTNQVGAVRPLLTGGRHA